MKVPIILGFLINTLIIVVCTDSESCEDESDTVCSDGRNPLIEYRKALVEYTFNFLCDLTQIYPNKSVNGGPAGSIYLLGLSGLYSCGETHNEILRALNLKSKREIRCVFSQINEAAASVSEGITLTTDGINVITDECNTFTRCYKQDVENLIIGRALNVDLSDPAEAANEINCAVAEETNNLIQNVISSDDIREVNGPCNCQKLLFVSGFFFTGDFLYRFNSYNSIRANFYGALGTERATYLYQTAVYKYLDSDELDAKILSVPLISKYRVLFILPNENGDRDCIIQKMKDYRVLDSINSKLRDTVTKLYFPGFDSINTTINTGNILQRNFDVPSIFDPNKSQFENITVGNQCLYSAIGVQKFVFKSSFGGGPPPEIPDYLPTIEYRLNRPYIYLISLCVDTDEESTYMPVIVGYRTSVQ